MSSSMMALWSFFAGVGIPLVGVLNGGLARAIGSPFAATATVFAIAFAAATLLSALTGTAPAFAGFAYAPARSYLPGLIMGFYALSATVLIPRFGVGNFVLFILFAQVTTSAVVDHYGLLGVTRRPLDALRLGGLALVLAGLAMTQVAARRAGG